VIPAAVNNSSAIFLKSLLHPTKNGEGFNVKQRFMDALCSAISQTAVSLYKEQGDSLVMAKNGVRGILERLYDNETNPDIKKQFRDYIK